MLDRLVRAWWRYVERQGDQHAAAIAFFGVLALAPLLMIAFAAAGYLLSGRPDLLLRVQIDVAEALPPALGPLVGSAIGRAVAQRDTLGALGVVLAVYTGTGWMSALRHALTEQWRAPHEAASQDVTDLPSYLRRFVVDAAAAAVMGLAVITSFAITTAGTGLSGTVLRLLGLDDAGSTRALLFAVSALLTVAANWLIFLWAITRLPRRRRPTGDARRAALMASIGFLVLEQAASLFLGIVSRSPAGLAFGPVIGLLIFAFLVSRLLLFVTCWTAVGGDSTAAGSSTEGPPSVWSTTRPCAPSRPGIETVYRDRE